MANKNGVKVLNPPFHPNMLSIGPPSMNSKSLVRGRMVHSSNADDGNPLGKVRGRINFLYNPSSISVSHAVDPSLKYNNETAQQSSKEHLDHLGAVVGIGNVSIPLLFDRTYDLWDSSKAKTLQGRIGVYADVLAFYHFLGLTGASVKGATDLEKALAGPLGAVPDTQIWANMYPSNPMFPTFCYAYIGNRLKYYGQVIGLDVTYTHWTNKMVPMRCAVNVSMELLVDEAVQKQIKIDSTPYSTPNVDNSGTSDFYQGGLP